MESEDVSLVALTRSGRMHGRVCKDGAVEPIGGATGFDLLGQIAYRFEDTSRLRNS